MGLPSIPLDGTQISVFDIDLTDMHNAAAKGSIKVKLDVGGIELENTTMLIHVIADDTYCWTGMFVYDNTPFVINVNIHASEMFAHAVPLTTAAA